MKPEIPNSDEPMTKGEIFGFIVMAILFPAAAYAVVSGLIGASGW